MSTFKNLFRISTLALVFVVLSSCASKKTSVNDQQAMLYFGAGTQSLMTKNYTDALTNLLKADRMMPGNADIITNLGMAYYFKGQRDLAINELNRALKIDANHSDAKLNLASIYYQSGDIDRSEKYYLDVLKDLTYDKQARTLYNLGILEAEKRKNLTAAESYFQQSLKEDENYCPAFNRLGMIQYQKGKYNTAEKTFYNGTRGVCVESVENYYYHALTLIELRRYEDARLRLDEIDLRFKDNRFAELARNKLRQISKMGTSHNAPDVHASRRTLESPEF